MPMEIDRLEVAIEAQASSAVNQIDRLYEQLNKVSGALGGTASAYRSSAREIGRVATAVRSLSAIRIPDFSKLINQLQMLAGINLNNLSSKKIKIDVELGGAAGANYIKDAIEDVLEKSAFDTSAISDRLLKAFNIDGRTASRQVRSTVQQIATELARSFDGERINISSASEALFDTLIEDIWENGKLVEDGLGDIEKEYAEFIAHMNRHPMKVSARDVGKSEFAEMRGEMLRYFNSKDGVSTDNGFFKELQARFKNIFPQEDVANVADQVSLIIEKIKEARDVTAGKPLINLTGDEAEAARSAIWDAVGSAGEEMRGSIANSIQQAMKSLDGKLMLDVEINEDKIQRDIRNAINRASQVKYDPIKLTLDVDNKNVKNVVQESVANMDAGTAPQIASAYESIVRSMQNLKTVAGNKEIEKIIGSIQRLARTDMSKFDSQSFKSIADTIERLASLPDVSANVNRLVGTITRLARSGEQMKAAATELPALASGLEQALTSIGASGGIADNTTAALESFSKIATAGDKISTSASGIPAATSALVDFLDAMASAPEASASTQSLVSSFAAIATAGKRVGNVGDQVSRAYNSMATSGARSAAVSRMAATAFNALKKALSGLEKAAKAAVTAMGKISKACLSVGAAVFNPIGALHKFGTAMQSVGNKVGLTVPKVNTATLSFRNLLRAVLPFYGIRSIFGWGKEATELASDLTEVQNVVENSFGTKGTEMVENFADSAIQNFGMTELTAKQIASRYQAMGNAMGITTGQIAKANENMAGRMIDSYKSVGDGMGNMSVRLTMLAADMASFYNVEQETVAEALNAVYTGQTRPLRQYGIDLTQATLQEWANKQGIDAKVSSMSQAEKTMLRYQYVIASTSTIQGDFARTSMTWANQVRMLKQNMQALASVVGGTLVNAFRPLIVWLNTAIASVISFAETVGNALGKIFGWQIMHTPASNAADVYDTLTDSLDGTEAAGDGAADSLGKATKAAEEYKNTVLGFDELNKLNGIDESTNNPSPNGGNGGGSGSPGIAGVDGTGADFQLKRSETWFEAYKSDIDTLEELGEYIGQKLKSAMEDIPWDDIYEKARGFGSGLADFLNGLFKDPTVFGTLGGTIADAVNTVLNAEDAFLDKFNFKNLGKSLGSAINGFFSEYNFDLKAKTFYKLINGIIATVKSAADEIEWNGIGTKISNCVKKALKGIKWQDAYSAASSFGSGLGKFLNGLISPETFKEIGRTVSSSLNTALQFLNSFGSTFDWTGFGDSIAAAISGFFTTWDPKLTAETFNTFALGLLSSIKSAISGVSWESVGAKISLALKGIDWVLLLQNVGDVIMGAINAVLELAAGLFDGTPVEDAIKALGDTINDIAGLIDFESVSDGFKAIADACAPFVSGFAIGLTEAFGALADIGVATLKAIGTVFTTIADALNSLPEGALEAFGEGLGKVAGALSIIALANGAAGVITKVVGGLSGAGAAGTAAATGTAAAAGGVGGLAAKFGFLTTPLSHVLGGIGTFIATCEATKTVIDDDTEGLSAFSDAYIALNDPLREITDAAGLNNEAFAKIIEPMQGISSTDGPALVQALSEVRDRLLEAGGNEYLFEQALYDLAEQGKLSDEALGLVRDSIKGVDTATGPTKTAVENLIKAISPFATTTLGEVQTFGEGARLTYDEVRGSLENLAGKYEVVEELLPVLSDQLGAQEEMGSSAERGYLIVRNALEEMTGKTGEAAKALDEELAKAFLGTGDNAEGADGKIGTMKANLWKFAGGVALKTILLAAISTVFQGFGTDAEDADEKIGTMQTNASDSMSTLGTDAKTAGTEFTNGLIGAIEDGKKSLETTMPEIAGQIKAPFADMGNDMYDAGYNITNQLSGGMKAGMVIPTITPTWTRYTYGNGGWFDLPDFSIAWNSAYYAKGGFPNLGDLFIANEAGPELVGKMGRKNAVANNMQITEGIREAVVDGMMEVFMTSNGNRGEDLPYQFNIQMVTPDGEVLARQVERGMAKRNERFNTIGYSF